MQTAGPFTPWTSWAYDVISLYETMTKDEITRLMLEKYGGREDVSEAEIGEVFSDVEELIAQGKLFSGDVFKNGGAKEYRPVLKALCLHVAHDCNLRCGYCFAGKGEYQGGRALMSFETGRRALDYLIEQSGTRRNLEVDFFGGRTADEFSGRKRPYGLCPRPGSSFRKEVPLYADDKRRPASPTR